MEYTTHNVLYEIIVSQNLKKTYFHHRRCFIISYVNQRSYVTGTSITYHSDEQTTGDIDWISASTVSLGITNHLRFRRFTGFYRITRHHKTLVILTVCRHQPYQSASQIAWDIDGLPYSTVSHGITNHWRYRRFTGIYNMLGITNYWIYRQ